MMMLYFGDSNLARIIFWRHLTIPKILVSEQLFDSSVYPKRSRMLNDQFFLHWCYYDLNRAKP
jgi:hypothetical protein